MFCVFKIKYGCVGGYFLGGPVVKILPSNAWDAGLIPGQGAKILHA